MVELTVTGIDRAKPVHPGDVLKGNVQLLVGAKEKALEVEQIRVYLEGRCKVERTEPAGRSSAVYVSEMQLCHSSQILFTGPARLGGAQSWEFQLQVPEEVTVSKPDTFRLGKGLQQLFDGSHTQPTPPSMAAKTTRNSGIVQCSINYTIKVEMRGPRMAVTKVTDGVSIAVVPFRTIRNPVSTMVPYADHQVTTSLHLDPQIGDRKLTMSEKLKTKLQRYDKLPQLEYIVSVEVPDSAIISEDIPVFLEARLKYDPAGQELPPVELKQCSVSVVRKISAASPSSEYMDAAETFDDAVRIGTWDPRVEASYPGAVKQPPVLLNDRVELARLMKKPLTLRGKTFSVAFKTFNISETHHIAVQAVIEVARKEVQIGMLSNPVTLFSPYYRETKPIENISKELR